MKLRLVNVGGISEAELEMSGFTVITGENSSGKSTVLKSIYTLIEPGLNLDSKIMQDIDEVASGLFASSKPGVERNPFEGYENLTNLDKAELLEKYGNKYRFYKHNLTSIELMIDYLKGNETEKNFYDQYIKRAIASEFDNQCIRQGSESCEMSLSSKECAIELKINGRELQSNVKGEFNYYSDIIYIDSPYVADDNYGFFSYNHREKLSRRLFDRHQMNIFDSIVSNESIRKLDDIIEKAFKGQLSYSRRNIVFSSEEVSELNLMNVATGMKIMSIIRMALDKGMLMPGSVLLIDEPEIHLHPKWQLILAELMVSMKKELGITIVLSTHSPQFLMSLEAYSKVLGVDIDYYFANQKKHTFDNVNGRLEEIYRSLTEPLAYADKLRNEDE